MGHQCCMDKSRQELIYVAITFCVDVDSNLYASLLHADMLGNTEGFNPLTREIKLPKP